MYRLTMGQARQEELVEYILERGMKDKDYIRSLFINLSPYIRTDEKWKERMREKACRQNEENNCAEDAD